MKETNRRRNSARALPDSDYESFYRCPWESDQLESNIKEIECTLFRLMDNEKEQMARRHPSGRSRSIRRKSGYEETPLEYSTETSCSLSSFESPKINSYSKLALYDSDLSMNLSGENNQPSLIESTPNRSSFFYGIESSPIQYRIKPAHYISPNSSNEFLSPPLNRMPNFSENLHETYSPYKGQSNYYNNPNYQRYQHGMMGNGYNLNSTPYQTPGYNAMTESPKVVQHPKKSVKMTVPSNKRQILEEEFRKEKYPCNEKLQKISLKLNMKYEEVQNYFKKRRREEKETNNKFSVLVRMLNNYLEQE